MCLTNLEFLFFLSIGLGSSLGLLDLGGLLLDGLDDTDSDSLSHVTDGEATQWSVVSELLDAHGLGWNQFDDGSLLRLDELGEVLNLLTGTTVDLLQQLLELAGNVSGVAVEDWCVAVADLSFLSFVVFILMILFMIYRKDRFKMISFGTLLCGLVFLIFNNFFFFCVLCFSFVRKLMFCKLLEESFRTSKAKKDGRAKIKIRERERERFS